MSVELGTQAAATASAAQTPALARVRYIGVDLARFTAIMGMMAAHLVGVEAEFPGVSGIKLTTAEVAAVVTNGTAAALFAVLGGLSIVFATRRLLREGRTGAAVASIAARGVVLMLIGFLLGIIDSDFVVVLAYYGLAMIVVSPLIALRSWIIATVASVLGLVGGIFNAQTRANLDIWFEGKSVSFDLLFADPVVAFRALLITGEYPVITWVVYLLTGILVGRAFTAATKQGALGAVAAKFTIIGAALLIAAQLVSISVLNNLAHFGITSVRGQRPENFGEAIMHVNYGAPSDTTLWQQLIAVPHSGSVGDLIRTIALSMFVIGALVWLFDRESVRGRKIGRPLDIVRATGAAPLTIYTLHIIVSGLLISPQLRNVDAIMNGTIPWWAVGVGAFALQLAGALIIGAVLSFTGKRGPLEAMLSKIIGLVVRR